MRQEKQTKIKKQTLDLNKKRLIWVFLVVLGIILIFTFIDFLIHLLKEEYAVPSYYFRNKIIFGTIIGFIAYLVFRKQKLLVKSLLFSLIISILLQIRYFLEGFPLSFVLLFLTVHFIILFPVSLIVFYLLNKSL